MFLVVLVSMPESIEYLVEKRPSGALRTYNRIARRLGLTPTDRLPEPQSRHGARMAWKQIFQGITLPAHRLPVDRLCRPDRRLLLRQYLDREAHRGYERRSEPRHPRRHGDPGRRRHRCAGFCGTVAQTAPAARTALILAVGAGAFVLYATQISNVGTALLLAVLVGVVANGGVAAFYAISPAIYPTVVRGTGVGLMIGFGRGVAILAPIATGYMLASGWTPALVYQLFGGVLLVSALAALLLDRSYRGRSENPETPDALAIKAARPHAYLTTP